jgi:hypothetical protein
MLPAKIPAGRSPSRQSPTNRTGRSSSRAIATAIPPLAVPSSLVSTIPVTPAAAVNSRACCNPFCPVVASITSSTSCGASGTSRAAVRRIFSSSSIKPVFVCSRPAVSTYRSPIPRAFAALTASYRTAAGSPPWRVLIISTPDREAHTSSCSMAAALKVSAAHSSTVRPCPRDHAANLPLVVVLPVPFTPTRNVTFGGAAGVTTGRCGASRIALICAFSSSRSSAPPSIACRRARSRSASRISVVVCTPISLDSSADSSSSRSRSSTVRVIATMPSIFAPKLSRVRVTACFMRLKKPDFFSSGSCGSSGFSGSSFKLPNKLINDIVNFKFRACVQPSSRGIFATSQSKAALVRLHWSLMKVCER